MGTSGNIRSRLALIALTTVKHQSWVNNQRMQTSWTTEPSPPIPYMEMSSECLPCADGPISQAVVVCCWYQSPELNVRITCNELEVFLRHKFSYVVANSRADNQPNLHPQHTWLPLAKMLPCVPQIGDYPHPNNPIWHQPRPLPHSQLNAHPFAFVL